MSYLTINCQMRYGDISNLFQQMSRGHLTPEVVGSKGVKLLISNIYIYIFRYTLYPKHPLLYKATHDFVDVLENKVFYSLVWWSFLKENTWHKP